ncbi:MULTISPECIES: Wzz/FepE/Etk N-terminal domain-containing protein [unclassified Streptococcus]|uniref:Wzz/FepE/Etk N-terminal domain-containing protein n=1 Tax=unclassified Streptococcus TaxID=2608887 RepID=UPI001071B8B0|nr:MULTISPECIES: Wzz/FepE/Etk N-terminal domain-containing protein [unclassified Streptococcus]MBF0806685.1 capsular biosynthesis protein CpsC [Streptococcus sp. 19428wA2_WM07]TFU26586.1 capsular biosynthesis protein CpsC [Streptococcus sp. WM07]
MKKQNNQVEVDILSLLRTVWKRKFLVIFFSLLTAILALGYSLYVATPMYQSTTRIYVVNRHQQDNPGLTNQDLQAGTYLVKDYKEIILSQDVMSRVISDLGLDMGTSQLASKINVTVPADTRIVSVSVQDESAEEAARIVNGVRQAAADKIIEVTKVSDVTTLEEGQVNSQPVSPNIRRNVLLGFVAGGALMVVIILVAEIVDDRVKKPEDVEEMMGLTLLGVVPDFTKLK